LILLLFLLPTLAFAKSGSDCGWVGDHIDYDCGVDTDGPAAGASAPLLGDTLGDNPAALPSGSTPFGIEGRFDSRQAPGGTPGFAGTTVKGLGGFGFGVGSWSYGTFSAPDFDNHFLDTSAGDAYLAYQLHHTGTLPMRFGAAVVLPPSFLPKGVRLSLGGSLGLGSVSGELAPQIGVLLRIYWLGLGFSNSYEHLSTALPRVVASRLSVGLGLGVFYLGFAHQRLHSDVNTTSANTISIRLPSPKWTLFAGHKWQLDQRGLPDSWEQAGVIRKLGRHFGIGYEYGEYRFSHSAILQLYL
jgi:hypothetical protein